MRQETGNGLARVAERKTCRTEINTTKKEVIKRGQVGSLEVLDSRTSKPVRGRKADSLKAIVVV